MSFKLKLANLPQPTADTPAKPFVKPQKSTRDILFGSGLTKRMAESGQKKSALNATSKKVDFAKLLAAAKQPDHIEDVLPPVEKTKTAKSVAATLPSELMPSDIKLDQWQNAASSGLRLQKYGVMIGAAGTGKTTTTRALLAQLEETLPYINTWVDGTAYKTLNINFASFMGKAVQQIKRAIPKQYHGQCSTLHALLEFKPVTEEFINDEGDMQTRRIFLPTRTSANPLTCKCIILDESGSIPVYLWLYLLDALPEDCRIYMLGDLNQLPPVGGHSILGFAMLKWPTYELKELHRNAGAIAEQAHRVIAGLKPQTDTKTKRVIVKKLSAGSLGARREVLAIVRHLYETGRFDPMQDGLIVPQNIEALGQLELNSVLVNLFNPPKLDSNGKPENPRHAIRAGFETRAFGIGDKVMLLKNNTETGLTNGMVGVITEININAKFHGEFNSTIEQVEAEHMDLDGFDAAYQAEVDKAAEEETDKLTERAASHTVTVHFADMDKEMIFATAGEINNITLAYAFTCHKAQGSEYRMVIVVCHSTNIRMLCREWLYTAMTRAKERLLILCNDRGLQHAVKTQRIKGETLEAKAKKFLDLQKGYDTDVHLQEPVEFTEGQFEFTQAKG